MKKSITYLIIPIVIGSSLFIMSFLESYPVILSNSYEFKFDEINIFYWISISILLGSFYLVSINTENNNLKYVLSILAFLIIHSLDLLHFTIDTSDNNHFTSLMEVFMGENILEPPYSYDYYQRPVFFIFNTIAINLIGFDYRQLSFIIYIIFAILISSFVFNYVSRKNLNGYLGVLFFIFNIFWYFNFQSAPYTISLFFLMYVLYLDQIRKPNDKITLLLYFSFIILSFSHVITPVFYIIYCFFKYYMSKDENDQKLFFTTLILFIGTNVYSQLFPYYLQKISVISFSGLERNLVKATRAKIITTPFIETLSETISKSITIGMWIVSSIGFLSSYKNKKLIINDYSMFFTSLLFTPFILITFQGYSQLFFRVLPLAMMVFSYSALYFINKNFNKIVIILLLIISISYVFAPIQQSFFDKQIFFISERTNDMNNFYHEHFTYVSRADLITDHRNMVYLRANYPGQTRHSDPIYNFSQNFFEYDYILYTIGLGRAVIGDGTTIDESIDNINEEKFNVIYNSGSYTQVYARARPRREQTTQDIVNMGRRLR